MRYQNLDIDPLEGCEEEKTNFTLPSRPNSTPPPLQTPNPTSSSIRIDHNNSGNGGNNNENQNNNNNMINSSSLINSGQNSSSSALQSTNDPGPPGPPDAPDTPVDYLALANTIKSYQDGLISNVPTISRMDQPLQSAFQKAYIKVGKDFIANYDDPKCYLPFILLPLGCLRYGLNNKVRKQRLAMLIEGKVKEYLISVSSDDPLDTTCTNHGDYSRFKTIQKALSIIADGNLRITSIDEFPVNVSPSQHMLFTRHRDMPGIIGQLGSLLGQHNVNIASMQVGRRIVRGDAVMVLSIDDPIPPDLLISIHSIDGIQEAHPVTL